MQIHLFARTFWRSWLIALVAFAGLAVCPWLRSEAWA
jgi:hypothetical protein